MLDSIRLSTRIYAQQILVLIALLAMGIYAMTTSREINRTITIEQTALYPLMGKLTDLTELAAKETDYFIRAQRLATLYQITQSANIKQKFEDRLAKRHSASEELLELRQDTIQEIKNLLSTEGLNDTDKNLIKQVIGTLEKIQEQQKEYLEQLGKFEARMQNGASLENLETDTDDLIKDMNLSITSMEQLLEETDRSITEDFTDIRASTENFSNILTIVVIVVTGITLLMTILTGLAMNALRKSVFAISGSVQQVATAASQSSNAISMVSDGAKTQTDSINQAVTAVEQSVSVLTEVSRNSEKATEISKISGQAVASGKLSMQTMVHVVSRIQDNSNKVNKITEIISGIASQTNMLALNAAIEAARAGEQGKGFAVVADQVKSLAESSKNSVDDIVELIEQAKADAAEAVRVAEQASSEMDKIEDGVRKTENMMQSISTAMEEQVSTTEELSHNMDTLRDIGTSNANAAEEITETIMELSRISNDTNNELKKFNI